MNPRIEQTLSVGLTLAALAIAGALVRREFFPAPLSGRSSRQAEGPPRYVANWREILPHGTRVGSDRASVLLVEFGDLECPFCKRFHQAVLKPALDSFQTELAFVWIEFPIPSHRFARPASRAAQCARKQGRFAEYVDATFKKQDSLGLKPWVSYARDASVPDLEAFERCVAGSTSSPEADSGVAVGRRVGVAGTPTILLNGWLYPSPPSDTAMIRLIKELLAEKHGTGARAVDSLSRRTHGNGAPSRPGQSGSSDVISRLRS